MHVRPPQGPVNAPSAHGPLHAAVEQIMGGWLFSEVKKAERGPDGIITLFHGKSSEADLVVPFQSAGCEPSRVPDAAGTGHTVAFAVEVAGKVEKFRLQYTDFQQVLGRGPDSPFENLDDDAYTRAARPAPPPRVAARPGDLQSAVQADLAGVPQVRRVLSGGYQNFNVWFSGDADAVVQALTKAGWERGEVSDIYSGRRAGFIKSIDGRRTEVALQRDHEVSAQPFDGFGRASGGKRGGAAVQAMGGAAGGIGRSSFRD